MIAAQDLSPAELAALLHFHADAGVDWLLEEAPVDRFAEFAAARPARSAPVQAAATSARQTERPADRGADVPQRQGATRSAPARGAPASPAVQQNVAMPDEQAVAAARFAAESARSLAELKTALEGFSGCNLKNSARNTIFTEGDASSGIMVIGPMPDADDDREGLPFAGKTGLLLDRMLAAIGLERSTIMLGNVVPWRPPGNRPPTQAEMDICRPFIERQIALAEPKHLLLLGNFTARFFFGGTGTIHTLRGQWRDVAAGHLVLPALASLHPQELLNAPASKSLAWQDLLMFRAKIAEG
ncbi:uracil-DNA glycosylase [Agrobacterium pusense]|jgi:uracil-DNA glycosylase family 4|uniref:Type-4 uracil-DNA glycosylase n=3 Tax=Bacteria TaxID=2 RepID=A0AA44J0S0_9HYPH|nr:MULTISPECIES: uracil-DNA glycosylase [Agrobacterium]EKJ94677.1 DNA polymerase [Bradyrhizobium lupini HPC(L)]MDP9732733.1 uracil-DNA glycosylase family 4 [Rhizobium sp. SORGH_AS_0285]MDP9755438.1 uracil-DNA glycosylase family 4 [Rhizobium sp. SORGH_AS_0260]TGR69861.1 uracil-DNA glycosylase [bacterium M00.F.Ca.ET.194.01.1.1]TGS55403.1 uracil-DNA glycosylase [bacterium M00.F.Ca.ET.179.01.1.1]TGV48280.1 uracil-DNA glycosylase [bacterium M00.F.Ca.ET.168.01.1.1]